MAMYFMSGKTFLKQYIEEDPRIVMKTQFIIVSSTIRKNGKYKKQVINANSMLYPSQELLLDYDDWKHNQNYIQEYNDQLKEIKGFLATLIKYAIEEKGTVVFLCGEREKKYYFLPLIQKFIEDKFGYHIYDYKKYKEGKEQPKDYNQSEVLFVCDKILKKEQKRQKEKKMCTEKGRKEIIDTMTKKELKKELQKRCLWYDGMSRTEMRDMLETFM